ncbi:glycoside hydrolase family 16 protein [Acidiferrimicrobium sp. IK]|uniref:glycoside hydrolase family 16 protein n=1 Tax=Acidiferrimicrobium sp. IK TaxID=2871700 RepID=UPI0021CB4913|nr:glycoside hydrolase family 16 protein [Acidiferrimicrobium sp. IK]MCU4186182.1 glycoside hydrolase family 16 protein [Acidiferrimicrobium sp. IK]
MLTGYDNFSGTALDTQNWWGAYSGQPAGDPSGWWEPSHVAVTGGNLVLSTYRANTPQGMRWVSGGVGQINDRAQTYGRYLVRMRSTGGKGISAIALLFPTGTWPPEVDFYEDSPLDNRRTSMSATLHYGPRDDDIIQHTLRNVDFTKWHVFGVDWTPGHLVYTIDGRPWAEVSSSRVPAVPMTLDIQSQALACTQTFHGCPDSTTPPVVKTEVDWVATYRMAPGPAKP